MAHTGIEFSWQWSQERDFIKGTIEQYSSHKDGSLPNDTCYVETKNEYLEPDWRLNPPPFPFGIIRLHAEGDSRVLKTIIVKYNQVEVHELTVLAHNLAPVTDAMLTNAINYANHHLLADELPWDTTIKKRYESNEDVHCPMVLTLHPSFKYVNDIPRFGGGDVVLNGQNHWFLNIRNQEELSILTNEWFDPQGKKDGKHLIIVKSLPGGYAGLADSPGYNSPDKHIYLETESRLMALIHEWGHYKGGLYDQYVCSNSECGLPPNAPGNDPVCMCPGPAFERDWDPWPLHPENIMSNEQSVGILPTDKEALMPK